MNLDLEKYSDGLIPAIIQDAVTRDVLMLGFMDRAAVEKTIESGRVTFFSRSKQRQWVKGETSGNFLEVVSVTEDCDNDALLIKARPAGPVCHTGTRTCFGEAPPPPLAFLEELESVIAMRQSDPIEGSYVSKLFEKGLNKAAQKVGEEAVELVIAAKDDDDAAFRNEAADLLFHFLILLRTRKIDLSDVVDTLAERRK